MPMKVKIAIEVHNKRQTENGIVPIYFRIPPISFDDEGYSDIIEVEDEKMADEKAERALRDFVRESVNMKGVIVGNKLWWPLEDIAYMRVCIESV